MRRRLQWLITSASRDTASGQFIAEIDGLRFIAILAVILFHLNWFVTSKTGRPEAADPFTAFLSNGHIGVLLFFVISGFVIALPFARAHLSNGTPPRLSRYLTRRLSRLEPPYIVNLLFRFALLPLATPDSFGTLFPHLLASMGYLHNVIYGRMSAINFVAWSLEIEAQFYLLAPLLSALFRIRSKIARRSLLVALIAGFSIASYVFHGSPRFDLSILATAHYFLTGFLLVDVYLTDWGQNPATSKAWDLISVAAWSGVAALPFYDQAGLSFLVIPVFVAYLAAFKGTLSSRFFRQPFVYVVGGMCYTLYLYHYSVLSALGRPLLALGPVARLPLWLQIVALGAVIVPAVLLFGTVMFVLVEKPCMKKDWHLKLMAKVRARLAGSGGAG